MNHNSHRKNIFKKKQQQNNNLKTNGRWKNFQKTVETEKTNTFQKKSRFDNFDSSNEGRSNFGKKQHSRFGKKRFYKSKYNKKETMEYFKKEKNATQRNVSLFDFAKKKTIKKEEKPKLKKTNETKLQENKITQAEKNFILNQYMYEEETDDEEEETNITLNITEKQNNDIIDF